MFRTRSYSGRFLLLLAVFAGGFSARAERVEEREFVYRATVDALTFAEEAETISNPLMWPQLKFVVPDGMYRMWPG